VKLKFVTFLPAAAGLILFGACHSVTEELGEHFTPVEPQVQQVDGDLRGVAQAVRMTFEHLGFTLTSSSQSRIEASSPINTNTTLGDARQLVAEVHLKEASVGRIDVEMLLTQQVEDSSPGGKSESSQKLREHGFYGTFFQALQQMLREHPDLSQSPTKTDAK
jgi:hypothetical protein